MTDVIARGVETEEELRLANDLMAKCFGDYFNSSRALETMGVNYPGFQREHTRVALMGTEVVGAHRINTDTIRIGEARLRMGGFGWVATSERHRRKGIASAMLQDSLHYMADHGYHVSMLFGIPDFYHKFGYATALAEYVTSVDVLEATAIPHQEYRIRDGKPGDIRSIQKMHDAHDGAVACSIIRSGAHITNLWERWKRLRVLTDVKGKMLAYFLPREHDRNLTIDEVGVQDWRACGAVLHACAGLAAEKCIPRVRFAAPPPHPFIRYLLQYRSVHETHIERNAGGMLAFVDLYETLESLIPEWENLLTRYAARETRAELTLIVDRKPCRIRANRGAIDVAAVTGMNKVSVSSAEMIHLVTGYRHADDIYEARRRMVKPEARELFRVLFPKRTSYVWTMDRF